MVSQLQLIVYLCLMNFNFPGNMHFLLQNLQGLADLKLIPSEFINELFGDDDKENMNPNLEVNGYSSSNFLVNLGGFLVVIILLSIFACLLGCFGLIIKKMKENPTIKKWYYKMYYKIFWGIIIQCLIHSYTKIAISNMISLKQNGWSKKLYDTAL